GLPEIDSERSGRLCQAEDRRQLYLLQAGIGPDDFQHRVAQRRYRLVAYRVAETAEVEHARLAQQEPRQGRELAVIESGIEQTQLGSGRLGQTSTPPLAPVSRT